MNNVLKYVKLLALAGAMVLVFSGLDNVPDEPRLLDSSAGLSVFLQSVHHSVATRPVAIQTPCATFRPVAFGPYRSSDAPMRVTPVSVPRSLYQAADPSPPSA